MIVETLTNDIEAVKTVVSDWAKDIPILGDLSGDGEKVKGDRLHLTTENGGASSVKTETTGEAPEVKADLLLAAMGAAAPSIPEPNPLNFAEAMSKLSGAIEVAGGMQENPSPTAASDTIYTKKGGVDQDVYGNKTGWSQIVVNGDTSIVRKKIP